MDLEKDILTSFVIIEKMVGNKYNTPYFDIHGNRLRLYSSISPFFISPGVYTIEYDCAILSEIIPKSDEELGTEMISYDFVSTSKFKFRFNEEKNISLIGEKSGKFIDSS